jgi:multidrug efflux pump subunit AcrB
MKNLSAWAIRHPVTPIVLFVVLTFLGIVAFIKLPINLDPDIAFPDVDVNVSQPGAAPSEMETQIAQKIEGSVASIGNVRNITTYIFEGVTHINVEFQIGTPVDRAVTDVRDAVAKVRADLPRGIMEPLIERENVDGGAFAYYGVTTTALSPTDLSWFIDNTITKRLLAVPGVAQVQRNGGVDREIRVDLDPARLQALGVTAVEVNEQVRALNLDAPGGRAQVAGGEQAIRVLGGAKTAADLAESQIIARGGRTFRLREIADVHDGVAEVRMIARLNGRIAVMFGVFKAKGASDVSVSRAVQTELDKIESETHMVHMTLVQTNVSHTLATYHSSLGTLIEGSILAVLVVWLFLRSWPATFISALAIPLSALPTFAFMQLMGFTLNSMTLLALSLVAGVLVDDAIVEIENIVRHMRMGKSGYQAALDAADEIGLAVVATSFTIIAVFLPVSFMGGVTGQFFKQFGLTVAAAVFVSLLVARLITPVLAAYALRPDVKLLEGSDGPIMKLYQAMLRWCVAQRWKTIGMGFAFLVVSLIAAATLVSWTFLPADDFASSLLNIEVAPGGKLEDIARASGAATAILRRSPEVTDVAEFVGASEGEIRNSMLFVSLVPRHERAMSQKQWEQSVMPLLSEVPDAHMYFASQNPGGSGGRDLQLYLIGDDPARVEGVGRQLVAEMRGISDLRAPRIRGDLPRPEILVHPRLDIAAQMGVSVESISETIRIATLGDLPQNGAKFSLSDRQIPIRVSLLESSRRDLSTLENLPVPTASGGAVPLKSVADLSFGQGPSAVRRYNQNRRVFVEADLGPGVQLSTALSKVNALPTLQHLPLGVHLIKKGDAELLTELMQNFALVFQPITILTALPLSWGGVVLALLLTNKPASVAVVIGLLMLMGIVGKNSILLVDFAIEEMRAGKSRVQAILEAGHKRARPIVMTTVAMVAGMLPVAVGLSGDSEFRAPMAIAVIGGLITSTLLTLVVVPAVFTVFDDIEHWTTPFARKLLARAPATGHGSVEGATPGRADRVP